MNITTKFSKYEILELIDSSSVDIEKLDSINKNLIYESIKLEEEVESLIKCYQGLNIE